MEQLAESLDRRDHAGHDILSAQQALDFRLDALPGATREFAQELAIESCVNSQSLGDGEDHLPVGDGSTDFFGDMDASQQRPFLVAGGAGASLLAGKGHEHFMSAIRATHPGKTLFEIAALQKGSHGLVDDRAPVAVLGLITLVVDLPERLKMFIDQLPQVGGPRIAWLVQRRRLDARCSHEKSGVETMSCPMPRRPVRPWHVRPALPSLSAVPAGTAGRVCRIVYRRTHMRMYTYSGGLGFCSFASGGKSLGSRWLRSGLAFRKAVSWVWKTRWRVDRTNRGIPARGVWRDALAGGLQHRPGVYRKRRGNLRAFGEEPVGLEGPSRPSVISAELRPLLERPARRSMNPQAALDQAG